MQKIILAIIWLSTSAWSLAVPDGGWNGKPWDRDKLIAGANNFDADAMAEWAFCSAESISGIEFNKQQIYRRSKYSAEKGSALGKYMLASCAFQGWGSEVKNDLGRRLLKEALEDPHPEATRLHGVYQAYGEQGLSKNVEDGLAAINVAINAGSLNAKLYAARFLYEGTAGEIDLEGAAEIYKEILMQYQSKRAAENIFRFHTSNNSTFRSLRHFFAEEHFQEAEKILKASAQLKYPYGDYLLVYWDIQKGKLHEALPKMIANSRKGPWSHRTVIDLVRYEYDDADSNIDTVTMGKYSRKKAAEIAYRMGLKSDENIVRTYGHSLIYGHSSFDNERFRKGIKILRDLYFEEGPEASYTSYLIGVALCRTYYDRRRNTDPVKQEFIDDYQRGINHLILQSPRQHASGWLVNLYSRNDEHRDMIKAYAISLSMEKQSRSKDSKKEALARKKKILRDLDEKQKQAAEALYEEGFPTGEKWRRPAFEALKKIGDISPDYEFDLSGDSE